MIMNVINCYLIYTLDLSIDISHNDVIITYTFGIYYKKV